MNLFRRQRVHLASGLSMRIQENMNDFDNELENEKLPK